MIYNHNRLIRFCALVVGVSGLIIIFSTVFPILAYEWEYANKYPSLLYPIVAVEVKESNDLDFVAKDLTKASNWIQNDDNIQFNAKVQTYFSLSIPKLGIANARVAIGSEDLSDSLIQYPGTALPGKIGNTVIFGHSILPQYFDPKNYLSIFSTLPRLSKGDEVYVFYDSVTYKYQVESMFEVRPTDIQILEQSKSGSYLTLVTCTPPGHPLKPRRLIVRARLAPFDM
ncbi:MAG: sortase [Patescibacteria group bacterium]|nr:sortase [Patescibacteria group bacterium]